MSRRLSLAAALILTTACGAESDRASCEAYLDCAAAVIPASVGDLQEAYGEGGSCWDNASNAERCAEACELALEGLQEDFDDEVCWPEDGPALAFKEGTWEVSPGNACAEAMDWQTAELEGDASAFTLVFLLGDYDCVATDGDFDCEEAGGELSLSGTFHDAETASLTMDAGIVCEDELALDLSYDD